MTGLHSMMVAKPSVAGPPTYVAAGTHAAGFTVAATPLSVPLPAFQANDFGILIGGCENGSLNNVPSGWSLKLDGAGCRLWTRTLQVGDGNPGITATNNGARQGRVFVFRGVVDQTIEDSQVKGPVNGNDSGSPTNGCVMTSCDPATANALIFQAFLGTQQTPSWTVDAPSGGSGFSEAVRVTSACFHAAGYRIVASPGSYTPYNWTVSGNAPPYPFRYGMTICFKA